MGDFLVFVEVKYRKDESFVFPLDTFTPMKRTVLYYVMKNEIDPEMIRIDFIIIMPKIERDGHRVWHLRRVEI